MLRFSEEVRLPAELRSECSPAPAPPLPPAAFLFASAMYYCEALLLPMAAEKCCCVSASTSTRFSATGGFSSARAEPADVSFLTAPPPSLRVLSDVSLQTGGERFAGGTEVEVPEGPDGCSCWALEEVAKAVEIPAAPGAPEDAEALALLPRRLTSLSILTVLGENERLEEEFGLFFIAFEFEL